MLCLLWGFYSSHVPQKSPERDAASALTKQTACKLVDRFTDNSPEPSFHSAHGDLSGRGELWFFLLNFYLNSVCWYINEHGVWIRWRGSEMLVPSCWWRIITLAADFPQNPPLDTALPFHSWKKVGVFLDHLKIRLSRCCPNLPDWCVSFYQMDVFWQ